MSTSRSDVAFLFDVDNTLFMSVSSVIVAINARLLRLKKGQAAE